MKVPPIMKCIVCKKDCEILYRGTDEEFDASILPVNDGMLCRAYGNYGSTSFDPLGSTEEFLSFVVCDECMVANAEHIIWARHKKTTKEYDSTPWSESDELPSQKSA